jgi:hypothetical protein
VAQTGAVRLLPLNIPVFDDADYLRFVGQAKLQFNLLTSLCIGILEQKV